MGAVVIMGEDVRVAQALFGLETRGVARRGEIVAIEIAVGVHRAAAGVEAVRTGGLIPLGPAGTAGRTAALHRFVAVAGSVGQRFDAAGDDGVSRHGGLAAEGAGRLPGLLDLALVHAVVVAVEVPRRAADDTSDKVLGVVVGQLGPRAHVDALRQVVAGAGDAPGRRGGVGAVLRVGDEARDGDAAGAGIGFEESRAQRRFIDEAQPLRRLVAVAGHERGVGTAEQVLEVARRPFGGARGRQQELVVRTELVDEVGAVVVEVHGHAVGADAGSGDRRVRGAVEERLLALLEFVGRRKTGELNRGVLLPWIELDAAIHGVGQFERGRKVDLHAAAVGVGQRRVGIGGDVVPEDLGRVVHRLAGRDPALLGGPSGKPGDADRLGELVGLRIAGRVGDVLGAPVVEVVAAGQDALGVHALFDRIAGAPDDADGVALIGRAGEALVPFFGGKPRAAAGRGVVVRQVDLGLHAFVADPERITTVDAERLGVAEGGAGERLRARVDGAVVVALERGQAVRQVDRAVGDKRHDFRRVEADRGAEVVDVGLGFGEVDGFDDAAAVRIGVEVGAVRDVIGLRAGKFGRGVGIEGRGEPAQEETRVGGVGDIPVADARGVDAAGRPDAGEVALLVR